MKIRIGTRASKLALWQAHRVQDMLRAKGAKTEVVKIETKGDKVLDVTLSKIGSKGVFTEEIEEQLKAGEIDIAVHSAKDVQSKLPPGFEIIAFDQREEASDVLVSHKPIDLNNDALVLGTASTRRLAFLAKNHPSVGTVTVRGNLQTRIKKMKEGACDALWLAYAGVHRMGYDDMIVHRFDMEEYIPAVGQGSVAIEIFETLSDGKKELIRSTINHEPTAICLRAERAFLRTMDGGCSIPVFAKADWVDGVLSLRGGIISLDGKKLVKKVCNSTANAAEKAGETLASSILRDGGAEILNEIRKIQKEQVQ